MTLVIARKQDERIVLIADTRIDDPRAPRKFLPPTILPQRKEIGSVIPGRLKIIVMNRNLTVAFAGQADIAWSVVRHAKRQKLRLEPTLHELTRTSREEHVDFIAAFHRPHAELIKITNGQIIQGHELYRIGDPTVFDRVVREYEQKRSTLPQFSPSASQYESELRLLYDENCLYTAFRKVLYQEGGTGSVGGFLIESLASLYGHCYASSAYAFSAGPVTITGRGEIGAEARRHKENTGEDTFKYTTVAPRIRGVAVIGVFMEQNGYGCIYAPFIREDAMWMHKTTLDDVRDRVEKYAHRALDESCT